MSIQMLFYYYYYGLAFIKSLLIKLVKREQFLISIDHAESMKQCTQFFLRKNCADLFKHADDTHIGIIFNPCIE